MGDRKFIKSNLQTGDLVEFRNGDICKVYRGTEFGDVMIDIDGYYTSLPQYEDDLKYDGFTEFDVLRIHKTRHISLMSSYCLDDFELIAERGLKVQYISGVLFGDNIEFMWNSEDIECSVGDIVEVETLDGLQLAKVIEVMLINSPKCDEDFSDINNVVRKIEY